MTSPPMFEWGGWVTFATSLFERALLSIRKKETEDKSTCKSNRIEFGLWLEECACVQE